MRIDGQQPTTRRAWLRGVSALGAAWAAGVGAGAGGVAVPVVAQVLDAPVPGVAPVSGQGLGHHGAQSPFPPLTRRDDVVPWSVLGAVGTRRVGKRLLPEFTPTIWAFNGTPVRIQGFMMPLEPGERHRRFLLASVPLTCAFCVPGGPESMLDVHTRSPVPYRMVGVVVQGVLQVLPDDAQGLYYRMTDAIVVP